MEFAPPVRSSLSAEDALNCLAPRERKAVEDFLSRLRGEFAARVKDVRLFGSKLRGDSGEDSDIDLLVLIDGLDAGEWRRIVDMAYSASPWIDARVGDWEAYHAPASRATGFYQQMRRESVHL